MVHGIIFEYRTVVFQEDVRVVCAIPYATLPPQSLIISIFILFMLIKT